MSLILKYERKEYTLAPEGLHQVVACDVVDLGVVETTFGPKQKLRIVFQTESEDPETKQRYMLFATFNANLHPKGNLRKLLESWRGRRFTEQELAGFDIEALVGANGQAQVVHEIGNNGTEYANITAMVPLSKTMPKIAAKDYTRSKNRQDNAPTDEDEVPF